MITEAEFRALAAQGHNRIPLVEEVFADLDTPLSLYLKLANAPYSFLLESVVGGERFGRYSFIGLPAKVRVLARGRAVEVVDGDRVTETFEGDPLAFVEQYRARFNAAPLAGLPRFSGGLAGIFGYDVVRHIETRLADTAKPPTPGLADVPDLLLLLTEELAVVDNLKGKISLIVYADPALPDAYRRTRERLTELRRKLREPVRIPLATGAARSTPTSQFGEDNFKAAVARAKDYIAAGDIMQVVISQRMTMPFDASPLSLYRALRSLNPSPYMFYYDFGDFHVVGASPEILVRKEGAAVTLRPIAGTRPRGATREADEALAAELAADPKEIAEHVMLLDLGRNDVGRVAQIGSVRVADRMVIERYSHVMHIVSNVEGTLRPGLTSVDVLRAAFPAGTVSGAPKVRAMEIIDELEPSKRGIYSGAAGYISFQDDMDTAIVLRTAVLKDGVLYAQAGGGIVHDSSPDGEWQ
jgi:anthranilate synthase component I